MYKIVHYFIVIIIIVITIIIIIIIIMTVDFRLHHKLVNFSTSHNTSKKKQQRVDWNDILSHTDPRPMKMSVKPWGEYRGLFMAVRAPRIASESEVEEEEDVKGEGWVGWGGVGGFD